jgi:hypothetical protein
MLSYCSTIARRAVFQGTRCASRTSVNNVALRRYGASGWRGMPIKLIDVSYFVRMDLICICMDDGVVYCGVCVLYFEVLWRLRRFCFCAIGREWIQEWILFFLQLKFKLLSNNALEMNEGKGDKLGVSDSRIMNNRRGIRIQELFQA